MVRASRLSCFNAAAWRNTTIDSVTTLKAVAVKKGKTRNVVTFQYFLGDVVYLYNESNVLTTVYFQRDGRTYVTEYQYDGNGNVINRETSLFE